YFFRIMGSKAPSSQSGRGMSKPGTPHASNGNSTLGDIYKRFLLYGGENAILYCSESGNP
ncbi:MAG: hypothetical protein ABWZ38_06095, partial [Candidatus Binatia bacterium]